MREIRFRAWDKVTKVMYEDAINNCKDTFDMILKHSQIYEVMQYTGIKDKNRVGIYEGDILEGGYLNPLTNKFNSRKYLIEYSEGCFIGRLIGHSPYGDTWLKFIKGEVIGNMFENSNLVGEWQCKRKD